MEKQTYQRLSDLLIIRHLITERRGHCSCKLHIDHEIEGHVIATLYAKRVQPCHMGFETLNAFQNITHCMLHMYVTVL